MLESLAIVANPKAGVNAKKARQRDANSLDDLLDTKDRLFWTRDAKELEAALKEIAQAGYANLGIVGGDGSIGLTLSIVQEGVAKTAA